MYIENVDIYLQLEKSSTFWVNKFWDVPLLYVGHQQNILFNQQTKAELFFWKTDFFKPHLHLPSVCISFAEKYLNFFKAVVELQSFPVAVVYFFLIIASLLWKKFTSPLGLHKVAF